MKIDVLFFGILTEVTGSSKLEVNDVKDIESLTTYLKKQFPAFSNYAYQVSVNHKLMKENAALNDKDEVAYLPPFAGG